MCPNAIAALQDKQFQAGRTGQRSYGSIPEAAVFAWPAGCWLPPACQVFLFPTTGFFQADQRSLRLVACEEDNKANALFWLTSTPTVRVNHIDSQCVWTNEQVYLSPPGSAIRTKDASVSDSAHKFS